MARAVTFDQTLFDECIYVFRNKSENYDSFKKGNSKSFLLTSFRIKSEWDLGNCTIYPSKMHLLPGGYAAFVSEINNPDWVDANNPQLFGIALSTIISFFTLEPCKSPRTSFLIKKESLSEEDIQQLVFHNPMLIMGPGAVKFRWSEKFLASTEINLRNFIKFLYELNFDTYVEIFQALRLIHLSILNKRDDFGLSFHLIVSAIESIAQIAIPRDSVTKENPLMDEWKEKANNDELFDKLLKEYKSAINNNHFITKRYVQFILENAPPNQWERIVPSHKKYLMDSIQHIMPPEYIEKFKSKTKYDYHPNELKTQEIRKILTESYTYRSKFVHTGKQPPHVHANPLITRFFEVYFDLKKESQKVKLLPNYELMIGIAKLSILNWLGFVFDENIEDKYEIKNIPFDIEKFITMEVELSQIYGPFTLFLISLDESEKDKWNIILAGSWLLEENSMNIIIRKMNEKLSEEEGKYIKNIMIDDINSPLVKTFHRIINQEHAMAEIVDSEFFGLYVEHVIVITSQKL